jgi:hypothetical protein
VNASAGDQLDAEPLPLQVQAPAREPQDRPLVRDRCSHPRAREHVIGFGRFGGIGTSNTFRPRVL